MLRNNLIVGLRNLWRNKTSAFINIFGLAIGMATAALILLWVQNEWSFDQYHTNAKQTYRVLSHIKVAPMRFGIGIPRPCCSYRKRRSKSLK